MLGGCGQRRSPVEPAVSAQAPLPVAYSAPLPDPDALGRDLDALRKELDAMRGPDDIRHLQRLHLLAWALLLGGLALSALGLNPLSPLLMALAASSRWMIVAHHTGHGALDGLPGVPAQWTSQRFARGWWRWLQWPDWIEASAWHREHNQLHHAYTNESADPDLVEQQMQWLRQSRLPMMARYALAWLLAATWRWLYYAPNTSACLVEAKGARQQARPLIDAAPEQRPWNPLTPVGRRLWLWSWLPYGMFQFGLLPALLLPLGTDAWLVALVHCVLADVLTNLHTFVVIVPNHAGADMVRWTDRGRGKGTWYLRQILSSCNYHTGHPLGDWLQGYLNYQIEHHLWPDMTPRQYAAAAPKVQAICAKHGIPYVQEPVWRRLAKMLRIMTGQETMLAPPAPDVRLPAAA